MEVPPNSLQREEVNNIDLGRRSPWWGRRQEGTSDHHQSWIQFLCPADAGWCPSKPSCCATTSLQSSSLLNSVEALVESRAEPKLLKKPGY